jgi:hypothetical protein
MVHLPRNDLIFKGVQPSIQNTKALFKKEMLLVGLRAKPECDLRNHFNFPCFFLCL